MNNEDLYSAINNKKLEVKNTVFLHKETIEKLKKYDLSKAKIIVLTVTILLAIINYFTKFVGLLLYLLIICAVLFIVIFLLDFYIQNKIKRLEYEIRKLEQFFKELQSKEK